MLKKLVNLISTMDTINKKRNIIKKSVVGILFAIISFSINCNISEAATYEAEGFICKTFKVIGESDVIHTITGSVLYQKGIIKDTIVFEGITTNGLTAEFTGYVGNSSSEVRVHSITLPSYNGTYKYRYETKEKTAYTYGKLKINSTNGTNYLKATQEG